MIRQVILSDDPAKHVFSNPIVGEHTIKAIAVNTARNIVYWTDGPQRAVKRGRLPDNGMVATLTVPQDLQIAGLQEPLGITYDWYSE